MSGREGFSTALAAALAGLVVLADQATKFLAAKHLAGRLPVPVFESWFHLTYHRNTGGIFGLFAGPASTGRKLFFIVATSAALAFIVYLFREWRRHSTGAAVGLSLVAGGAVGNLIDRVLHGQVTDFIDWHVRGHHWPAFNIADSAITVGTVILVAVMFFTREGSVRTS